MSLTLSFSAGGWVEVPVLVTFPFSLEEFDLRLELDTASRWTAIPQTVLDRLRAHRVDIGYVTVFDGSERMVRFYEVDIEIDQRPHKSVQVIAVAGDEGILGRDLLHQHVFEWHGPEQSVFWAD